MGTAMNYDAAAKFIAVGFNQRNKRIIEFWF